ATQLRLSQPQKLLDLIDQKDRSQIKSPELKLLVGIALLETGAKIEGEKLVDEARSSQPQNPAMYATLARYYLSHQQIDPAIATLQAGLQQKADNNLRRLLISAYLFAKKPDKALDTAREIAKSEPPAAENWWTLGRTALLLQKQDVAESALQKALALKPDFLPAQLDLAQLHLLRKQFGQAETLYTSVLQMQPDSIGALKG